jgi:hypothetical protein
LDTYVYIVTHSFIDLGGSPCFGAFLPFS